MSCANVTLHFEVIGFVCSFQRGEWQGGGVNSEDDRTVQEREQGVHQKEPVQTGE